MHRILQPCRSEPREEGMMSEVGTTPGLWGWLCFLGFPERWPLAHHASELYQHGSFHNRNTVATGRSFAFFPKGHQCTSMDSLYFSLP